MSKLPGFGPYQGLTFQLSDLVEPDNYVVKDRTFIECDISGPGILLLAGPMTMWNGCTIEGDPDSVLWVLQPERQAVVGAIAMINCEFWRCRFTGVGLAGGQAWIDNFQEQFEKNFVPIPPEKVATLPY